MIDPQYTFEGRPIYVEATAADGCRGWKLDEAERFVAFAYIERDGRPVQHAYGAPYENARDKLIEKLGQVASREVL